MTKAEKTVVSSSHFPHKIDTISEYSNKTGLVNILGNPFTHVS